MPVPFRPAGVTLLLALLCALPACADAISDSIAAAQSAYAAGDLKKAGEDLRSAQAQLQAMQGEKLAAFLPEAPESWTRTVSTDMGAGLAILGGGSGAEARYAGSGESFTITITADNPMVTGMGAMLSDESMIASIGKLTRIADRNFVDQDG